MTLSNNLKIKCNKCGHVNSVNKNDLDFDSSSYENRGMGTEIDYSCSCDIPCDKCNSTITIKIEGSEYPVGAYNHSSYECEGGEFVEEPTWEVEP